MVIIAGATLIATAAAALAPGPLPHPLEVWPNPVGIGPPMLAAVATAGPASAAVSLVLGVVALVTRYRRSGLEQRRQIKWLVYAVSVAVAVFATFPAVPATGPAVEGVTGLAFGLAVLAIPVGAGIGILRHRLYDIDLLIRRTVVYGALVVLITGCYLLLVVGVGALIGANAHIGLSIVATAVAAVAFQPARASLTRLVNRIVLGEPPDRLELLTRLADATAAAHEIDQVLPTMARIAADGVGAARVAVWLRRDDVLAVGAAWPPDGTGLDATVPVTPDAIEGYDHSYPVRHQGRDVGALAVALPAGSALSTVADHQLGELARAAGPVLENVRLFTELLASRARILAAQDAERRRIERDLHDGAQQRLVNLSLALGVLRTDLGPDLTEQVAAALDRVSAEAREALAELRELARGIHPAILTDRGLGPAVRALAERSPVPTVLAAAPAQRLPPAVEATSYFVVAEALANAVKHGAPAAIELTIDCRDGQVRVQVKDDGSGEATLRPGGGLQGLADRVAVLGGRLELDSAPGRGTRVQAVIPCG